MNRKDVVLVGLMLFSMFFGAGNLIFPPFLGMEAGTSFASAISGFILTGVGLPLLVLIAIAYGKNEATALADRVHPLFGLIFTVVVYLSIGPFFGVPRNANVAYEMGFKPLLGDSFKHSSVTLLLFTLLYFAIVYFVSINPKKMVDYMGKFITPVLLLAIFTLCAVAYYKVNGDFLEPTNKYQSAAFIKGFVDGYSTMDALAALAFGIVILTTIKERGVKSRGDVTKYMVLAGGVAGAALSFVYVGIGLLGAKMGSTVAGQVTNGTELLSYTSAFVLGKSGTLLLGCIFTLACFTTCVGLTIACGHYFSKLHAKLSYRNVVTTVTIISFLIANLGLNQIISISVPFLVMAYPLTIVLVLLSFLPVSRKVFAVSLFFTGIFAIYEGVKMFGLVLPLLDQIVAFLPLSEFGLAWVVPAMLGAILGFVIQILSPSQERKYDERSNYKAS